MPPFARNTGHAVADDDLRFHEFWGLRPDQVSADEINKTCPWMTVVRAGATEGLLIDLGHAGRNDGARSFQAKLRRPVPDRERAAARRDRAQLFHLMGGCRFDGNQGSAVPRNRPATIPYAPTNVQ